jgi:FdhD protein
VTEKALTLFLNSQEVVTMMTIGDHPDLLAVGYLKNQNMLRPDDVITGIEYDDDLEVVIVRTERETNFEDKLKKKVRTSGCAQGTVFGDVMEGFETIDLPKDAAAKNILALCADQGDQHDTVALSGSRRDPRLRVVPS